ncbi:MAG: 4-hydroxy-tetrahydrodipicolinate reductase [Lysobacterales bacterium]
MTLPKPPSTPSDAAVQPDPASARPLAIAIAGAGGRMGRQLLELVAADAGSHLLAAWVGPQSSRLGQPVPGTALAYSALPEASTGKHDTGDTARPDVVVDFSHAGAFDQVLAWCWRERVALVSGTTGLDASQHQALADAGADIPVLWSANFSLGVAVLSRLVAQAARLLPDWQAEIVEAHHAGKRDAPSGTALALGMRLAQARGGTLDELAVFDRSRDDQPRRPEQIGFAVVRAGDIVGEHSVLLAGAGERLELVHRAGDRSIFARGALHAARFLAGQVPGRYAFEDVLAG